MNRLRSLYGWDPAVRLTRQGKVPIDFTVKVPQGTGVPGWLCLTRDESSKPVSLWVPRREDAQPQILRLVMDERCYEDTILRVEYTPTHVFIADAWLWNGTPLFQTTTFSFRQAFLRSVIHTVYTPCTSFESRRLSLREENTTSTRGFEYYTDSRGEKGIYSDTNVPACPMPLTAPLSLCSSHYQVTATEMPDVYTVSGGGFLRVKTLATSRALRGMGKTFFIECIKNEDDTWTPVIESHTNTNGSLA